MSHANVFMEEISRLKKMVLMRTCRSVLLTALGIFLFICIADRGLEAAGIALSQGRISFFYILAGAISLAVSLFYIYLKKKSFSSILIDIDARLNLKDRVSTAYEYQRTGKRSILLDLLMQDAGYRLRRLRKRDIFPAKFSLLHLLLSLLLLANIGLYSVDRVVSASNHKSIDRKTLEEIREQMQVYTKRKTMDVDSGKKRPRRKIYDQLSSITENIENRSMTRDKLIASMNKVLKALQGEQADAVKELGTKLDNLGITDIALEKIYELENLSPSELKKLKMLLDRMFGNQIPESVKKDMAILDEQQDLEKFLARLIKDLNDEQFDPADEVDSDSGGDQRIARSQEGGQRSEHSKDASSDTAAQSDLSPDRNRRPSATIAGEGNGKDFDEFGGNYSSEAGNARAADADKSPYDIEKAKGLALKDKTVSSQAENYYVHIRSLSSIGKANLEEEDITRTYRQEIETILQKEDIPLNYREYIKNYFISIGLRTETSRK